MCCQSSIFNQVNIYIFHIPYDPLQILISFSHTEKPWSIILGIYQGVLVLYFRDTQT